ncbi:MAG: hypothetical protein K9G58_02255 [Bacteroidales bacterium]|nr:hypothetical protein [Bacteroidales bacterium]MCF8396959.1 hypothetical protein [Bacteroidales bacterium]
MIDFEKKQVETCLKRVFQTASDVFIDPGTKECEVKVSIDEYQGEIEHQIIENKVKLKMVDFCDTYPFKYVFSYKTI